MISLLKIFMTAMMVASLILWSGSSRLALIMAITSLFTARRSYTTAFFDPRGLRLSDPNTILCIASSCAAEIQMVLRNECLARMRFGNHNFAMEHERSRLPQAYFNFSRSTAVFADCSQVW
jgi:hypothetical protein